MEQDRMKTLLFILLFTFIGSVGAVDSIGFKSPFFYISVDDKVLICQKNKLVTNCWIYDGNGAIRYKCKAVTESEGYLKDCKTESAIKVE
jgi:hypothetical protein